MAREEVFPNHVDVLLVTVTEVEGRAVLAEVESQKSNNLFIKTHYIRNNTYFDLGFIGGARTLMVQSEMGASGPGGAEATVAEAIEVLSPSALIMLGIAFGVDEQKQTIGNILVARQLGLYELQRVGTSSTGELTIIPRGDRPSASPRLLSRFRSSCLKWPESHPNVEFGLLISGAKLIDNQDFREQLRSFAPEVIGGEMEGEGLYAAASRAKVDWIVVKAISDWADGKKNETKAERQKEAAKNAARFVIHTLMQGGFTDKPLSPPIEPIPSSSDAINSPYRLIIEDLKNGNLVPFLGPGINSSFYIDLALKLAEFVQNNLLSGDGNNNSKNEKLIQTLIGIPCSVCHYWPQDRPPECPMLKSIDGTEDVKNCPLYIEQGLAVSKINLRYLSQYYVLKNGLDALYGNLYEILEKLQQNHQPSALHDFLAKLPHLLLAHNYPRRSPGLPFQLIVTTNYDDMLEQAFLAAQ